MRLDRGAQIAACPSEPEALTRSPRGMPPIFAKVTRKCPFAEAVARLTAAFDGA